MIAIIKYNAGNIQSVLFALERIGIEGVVTDDVKEIKKADKVIFPGVGEARSSMTYLQEKGLDHVIRSLDQPLLGICLGMQLLCAHSEENDTKCLGIIPVQVRKFTGEKVPQIGWNSIFNLKSALFELVPEPSFVYNVHGYYAEHSSYSIASCFYGIEYAAALKHKNFYGVQFHTEKSSVHGQQILSNFIRL